jgi:hypothetical protein
VTNGDFAPAAEMHRCELRLYRDDGTLLCAISIQCATAPKRMLAIGG